MALFASNIITSDSALGSAVIKKSLKIDQGTSDLTGSNYSRTFGSGDRKTFTISLWVKKCGTPGNIGDGDDQYSMLSAGGGGSGASAGNFFFYNDDTLRFTSNPQPSTILQLITNRKFRDVTSWYHLMAVLDTTQATESNRAKIYVNGVQETSFSTATYPSQDNTTVYLNGAFQHRVGSNSLGSDISRSYGNFYGYFAEYNFVDGQALDPSSFGFTDPQTGIWMPKRYEGTYGTNGFYLDFTDNTSTTTLGIDKSPNGNDFTPEDVSTTDCVLDVPSNNFCTLNNNDNNMSESSPHFKYSEGNLKVTWSFSGTNFDRVFGNIFIEPGDTNKYYWEATGTQNNEQMVWGVIATDSAMYRQDNRNTGVSAEANVSLLRWASYTSAPYLLKIDQGSATEGDALSTSNGNAANNDIFSFVYDAGTGKFYVFFKGVELSGQNYSAGTSLFDTVDTTKTYAVMAYQGDGGGSTKSGNLTMNFGQDSSFGGNETATSNSDANGNGTFHTAPPSGFLALCSANLPEPTIGPNSDSNSTDHFNTVLFSGTGSSPLSVTGMGHQPDLLWLKRRDNATNGHHILYDSIRGGTNALRSSTNSAEAQFGDMVVTFASDGFSFTGTDGLNASSDYSNIAWSWLANGGTTTTNDASSTGVGTIDSVIQANTTAGFSIVTYTGSSSGTNGTPSTIAHGLGAVPKWIFFMPRDTYDGCVYHAGNTSAPATDRLILKASSSSDAAGATSDDSLFFNDTEPTSTVFSVGTRKHANSNGGMVAYCWADVEGFSKFGSYTGNLDTNGTFVYTGFKPAWLMIKNADEGGYNWYMYDNTRSTHNPNSKYLIANTNGAETNYSGDSVDFLSNGFKLRTLANGRGTNRNANHVYMAFAEAPFKYANAR